VKIPRTIAEMGEGRHLGRAGGYLGLLLLAVLITLGVMLALFTEDRGSAMQIDVGDVLAHNCDSTVQGFDSCYAFVVTNVSENQVTGSVSCTVTDPAGGFATFVNGRHDYASEPIPSGQTATVILQVDETDGGTDKPDVECSPA
jgi:hypothetical protein